MLPLLGEYVIHAAINFNRGILPPLIAALAAPALMLTLCWYLFTNSDKIAQACFPEDPPVSSDVETQHL